MRNGEFYVTLERLSFLVGTLLGVASKSALLADKVAAMEKEIGELLTNLMTERLEK